MDESNNQNITKEEIKKEFELERMILFSDAVFAIVITLMAIDIKLPEKENYNSLEFIDAVRHIAPVIIAYAVSFMFIGITWYKHLQIFSLLKTYNKGLIIRNLLLLFFIGLFPFGASVVTKGHSQTIMPFVIYMVIILLCISAQYVLHHYILYSNAGLRNDRDDSKFREELKRSKGILITIIITVALVLITNEFVKDPDMKQLSILWVLILPLVVRFVFGKRKSKKKMV